MQALLNHIAFVLGTAMFFAGIYIASLAYQEHKNRMPVKKDYRKQFGIK